MRIIDGVYYSVEKIDGENVTARCMHCNSIRKGSTKSSGNFIAHYKSAHPTLLSKLSNHLKKNASEVSIKSLVQPSLEESLSAISEYDVGQLFEY